MRTLYIECNMGAAGDMLTAALLELHGDPDGFITRLNSIGIPNVTITAEPSVKCGIKGTHIKVSINGHTEDNLHEHAEHSHEVHTHHHHNTYDGIEHLIHHLNVSDSVKKNTAAIYRLIAEAESHVHGMPVDKIHFHEVGEMDAVADIVAVCMLMEELAPDNVLASPVNTGSGHVHCAHGTLPVPAPATAYILRGISAYSDQTNGELCTPTGAAILNHFVRDFCAMPVMSVTNIGYGMGNKDFDKANCVRAFMGNATTGSDETVTELVCNLDDITPEALAFAQQRLLDEGALDVHISPIVMKKGRTGFSLTCMCDDKKKDSLLRLIFKHTTTLGIREYNCRRYVLHKEQIKAETEYGTVRVKMSRGFGVERVKPEYDDIAEIARKNNKSISEISEAIKENFS